MSVTEDIYERLEALGMPFRKIHHEAAETSAEAAKIRHFDPHGGAKALLVKNKEEFVIFVLPGDEVLDWKLAKKAISNKKARFATADEMLEATGLVKGSLPPFGNLMGMKVFMDEEITKQEKVEFNVGSRTDSIEMNGADLPIATEAVVGQFAEYRE